MSQTQIYDVFKKPVIWLLVLSDNNVSKDKKLLTEQDKNIEGCKNCSSGNLADKTIIENKIKTITQIIGIVS